MFEILINMCGNGVTNGDGDKRNTFGHFNVVQLLIADNTHPIEAVCINRKKSYWTVSEKMGKMCENCFLGSRTGSRESP